MLKRERDKLDKLWSKKIMENSRCAICGMPADDPHHFKTKKQGNSLRWYLPNGIPLCRQHHNAHLYSAHHSPDWFNTQIKALRGKDYIEDIDRQAKIIFKGNYQQILNYLEGRTNNYC